MRGIHTIITVMDTSTSKQLLKTAETIRNCSQRRRGKTNIHVYITNLIPIPNSVGDCYQLSSKHGFYLLLRVLFVHP